MSSSGTTGQFETAGEVRRYVAGRLSDFEPAGAPTRLPGGNLNLVWRVPGADRSLIVKYAPPYIAADPDTPLDPGRLRIEARCLKALSPDGRLVPVTKSGVHVPRPVDVKEEIPVLIMEDLGDVPSFDQWLRDADPETLDAKAAAYGRRLGRVLGRLHATTCDDNHSADVFDNRPMQETRLAVQYRNVADMLRTGGVDDAETLGTRAESLGKTLLESGRCLTMGDLWPSSVLVTEEGLRLIDWELAHYGRPLQDVAHWLAHLWMQAHRAPSAAVADAVGEVRTAFLGAYCEALGESNEALWDEWEKRDAAVHFGAELLVRAVGPFQAGYVYAGLAPDHPAVQEAVMTAVEHLRCPHDIGASLLRPGR
ncbi:MAG: phosphotransferase family protein [Salinibacter sp.]